MKKSRLLGAVCTFTFVVLANTAHAAVLNPILGLDIGGTLYNVTFHDSVGDSFNEAGRMHRSVSTTQTPSLVAAQLFALN